MIEIFLYETALYYVNKAYCVKTPETNVLAPLCPVHNENSIRTVLMYLYMANLISGYFILLFYFVHVLFFTMGFVLYNFLAAITSQTQGI